MCFHYKVQKRPLAQMVSKAPMADGLQAEDAKSGGQLVVEVIGQQLKQQWEKQFWRDEQ